MILLAYLLAALLAIAADAPPAEQMTPDEVAALIRRPVGTLRYWRHRTRAENRQIGPPFWTHRGRVLYPRTGVARWLDEQQTA